MEEFLTAGKPAVEPSASATPIESSDTQEKKSFSQEEVEQLLQARAAKAERKYAKRLAEFEALRNVPANKETVKAKEQTPLEAEYRNRLSEFEKEKSKLESKLNKHRQESLKVKVTQKLIDLDCLDPDIAFNDLTARGLVKLDDDDEIAIPELFNSLDELVKDYLGKRDYLVRAKRQGGLGTKAPNPVSVTGSEKDQIIAAALAVNNNKGLPFGRKK